MKKNYLVTGAAGFIGSKIAEKLVQTGNKVVTIDNLTTGYEANIPEGVEFIFGNCQDVNTVEKLSGYNFDAIFHIAGQSSGEISFDDPVYDLQTNTQSTLLLLKLAEKNKCKRFIYASSMSVYGDHKILPVNEQTDTLPHSFYAVGKIASEHYLRIFSHFGISSTALRLFNVYGPGQNLENLRQGMVSIYLAMALNDKKIVVKGGGNRFRDFIYIDDVVSAFLAVLGKSTEGFKSYNICTNKKTTVYELIGLIRKFIPGNVSVEFTGSTPGDQFGIYGDYSKIQKDKDWIPQVMLEEGIKRMADWAIAKMKP